MPANNLDLHRGVTPDWAWLIINPLGMLDGWAGKGQAGFCEGIQHVADRSEAITDYSGVRSCGGLPFENAPNGSNRWGLEYMDFGATPAYVKAGWSASEMHAASSVTTFSRPQGPLGSNRGRQYLRKHVIQPHHEAGDWITQP